MSESKIWLIAIAFLAGVFITPIVLILTTGHDEPALAPLSASPFVQSRGLEFEDLTPTPQPQTTATTLPAATAQPSALATAPAATRPSATPGPAATSAQQTAGVPALNGRFRIVDTVTTGQGSGTVVSFDVSLQQNGAAVTGGNNELNLTGRMEGNMLQAQFVQPGLGYSGTFTWRLDGSGGFGEFVTSVPNGGSSQLLRL